MKNKELIICSGTYWNKGGAAIVYGTLNILKELGVKYKYIIDPDPSFPQEFFDQYDLVPIYRWSDYFYKKNIKHMNFINTLIPFILCFKNSYDKQIRSLEGIPIWYIGNSSLNDYGSVLALFGQIINLSTLKMVTKSKLIVNASLGFTRTKTGEMLLRNFFKKVDFFFVRGSGSYKNLQYFKIPKDKVEIISDFAFYLNAKKTPRTEKIIKKINESQKKPICLIFKSPLNDTLKEDYLKKVISLISSLNEEYELFFVPTSYASSESENDLIFLKLLNIGTNIINIKDLTPEEIISIFNCFKATITMRLHGAVFSTIAGIPTYHIYEADNSIDLMLDTFGNLVPLVHVSDFIKLKNNEIMHDLKELMDKHDKKKMKNCLEIQKENSIKKLKIQLNEMLL